MIHSILTWRPVGWLAWALLYGKVVATALGFVAYALLIVAAILCP